MQAAEKCEGLQNYDDKFILKRLIEGKTRDEIASELGHKSYRTLDMYMRRHGYLWDNFKQTYVLKTAELDYPVLNMETSKVSKVISFFESGLDPREIAKKLSFRDHHDLAEYMKGKGYVWSLEQKNYVLNKCTVTEEQPTEAEPLPLDNDNPEDDAYETEVIIKNLLPMLQMINKNRDRLAELLAINESGTIPRYVIGGITITKSLCMSHYLAEMVKDFSKEKNISQREIFEVALIEFFKKYGFEKEVRALFSL
ncbi:hypothetical protein RDV78_04080 [Bacillota bacterium LX-D]|nr:hypothetical protein [Bacillota bacterium LX-D]